MAITEQQREQRRGYIGSSDIGAIIGVDPWRNAGDLWLDKTGKLNEGKSSAAADVGTFFEEAVIRMFEHKQNVTCERSIFLERDGGFPACANLDGAIRSRGRIEGYERETEDAFIIGIKRDNDSRIIESVVEAKSTSRQDEWDSRSGEIPLRVLTQTQWQMWVSGAERAFVPVLFPDFGRFRFEVFTVERSNALIEELVYRAGRFWHDHVLKNIPPSAVIPHLETLKRIRRVPSTVVELDERAAGLQGSLAEAKAACRQLEKNIESLQSEIISMLGDAEGGDLPDGSQITYLEQNGSRNCDFDLLRERLRQIGAEQIFDECVKQSRFRVLRHKKAGKR